MATGQHVPLENFQPNHETIYQSIEREAIRKHTAVDVVYVNAPPLVPTKMKDDNELMENCLKQTWSNETTSKYARGTKDFVEGKQKFLSTLDQPITEGIRSVHVIDAWNTCVQLGRDENDSEVYSKSVQLSRLLLLSHANQITGMGFTCPQRGTVP